MKVHLLAGAALASAFLAAGCNKAPAPANTAAPANVAAPAPAPSQSAEADDNDGGETPTAAVQGGAQQDFTIFNKTGHTVVSLNVSPNKENEWGPDILGRDVLNDGESAKITFSRAADECIWDVRATYDDDDTTEVNAVNLCEVGTVNLNP